MQILDIVETGTDYVYKWPDTEETYSHFIVYRVAYGENDSMEAKILFGEREVYGKLRKRILVLINGKVQAEFFGVDDFDYTGNIMSEIKTVVDGSLKMSKYPEATLPSQYSLFNIHGIPNFIKGKGTHNGWGVLLNIADHRGIISLGILRKEEREK